VDIHKSKKQTFYGNFKVTYSGLHSTNNQFDAVMNVIDLCEDAGMFFNLVFPFNLLIAGCENIQLAVFCCEISALSFARLWPRYRDVIFFCLILFSMWVISWAINQFNQLDGWIVISRDFHLRPSSIGWTASEWYKCVLPIYRIFSNLIRTLFTVSEG
jgi:hypothetical protein